MVTAGGQDQSDPGSRAGPHRCGSSAAGAQGRQDQLPDARMWALSMGMCG